MGMRESVEEQLADEGGETEINLTPMLDVVFIMLIFFIVTAVFVNEPGVEVSRPEAETAISPGGSIFVAITPENTVWIDGEEIDRPDVRAVLEGLKAENPESGVIIQSDSQANNETLISVMDAAKGAGINEIAVAAGQNQGGGG